MHALNEVSKGVEPSPAAAVLTISGPDGSVLGQFAADAQDAEILTKRVHEMSADRYGLLFAEDLEHLMHRYRQ